MIFYFEIGIYSCQKNSCMDELLDWKHISGPNPDLSVLVGTNFVVQFDTVVFIKSCFYSILRTRC